MKKSSLNLLLSILVLMAFFTGCTAGLAVRAENTKTASPSGQPAAKAENVKVKKTPLPNVKPSPIGSQGVFDNAWIGEFESEEGMTTKDTDDLEIKRQGDKITAIYSDISMGTLDYYFSSTVEIKDNMASFYYDQCLLKVGNPYFNGQNESDAMYPCGEDPYKKGDLMFKLVKSIHKNKSVSFKIIPVKFDHMIKGVDFTRVK